MACARRKGAQHNSQSVKVASKLPHHYPLGALQRHRGWRCLGRKYKRKERKGGGAALHMRAPPRTGSSRRWLLDTRPRTRQMQMARAPALRPLLPHWLLSALAP